ncbi:Protein of unknown function (DUF2997) [Synechococcus sp. PCC 7502]|uniref:DUF2997 domain-containing protein n=1 Tax=Synechococcus sp. PCC 7502 TaxID=1173263 RepID=UPI00029F8DB1|nr:DUF2997 domain-containing protein [Synechococcus sp. PCC 7502]AFY73406.1 Protein of unknown function (DUF2997) [Synechococcus sp. PCC 7502]
MTKYLKIEYLIAPDGKITERVINGSGSDCIESSAAIELELGQVQQRELLPEYFEVNDLLVSQESVNLKNQI